jgi:predicted nucleic acid-binding protein
VTRYVVDASAAASWLLKGQRTPSAMLLLRETDHDLQAPHLFPLEIRNVLLMSERRGRLDPAETVTLLDQLQGLSIRISEAPDTASHDALLNLARAESLTTYDALYLKLALDAGADLATRDADLIAAAVRRGVTVRDLRQ